MIDVCCDAEVVKKKGGGGVVKKQSNKLVYQVESVEKNERQCNARKANIVDSRRRRKDGQAVVFCRRRREEEEKEGEEDVQVWRWPCLGVQMFNGHEVTSRSSTARRVLGGCDSVMRFRTLNFISQQFTRPAGRPLARWA